MEVAIREHFAGYRSHTTLLAGAVFVFTVGGLFYLADQILAVALASARSPSRSPSTSRAVHSNAPPEASASGSVECGAEAVCGEYRLWLICAEIPDFADMLARSMAPNAIAPPVDGPAERWWLERNGRINGIFKGGGARG